MPRRTASRLKHWRSLTKAWKCSWEIKGNTVDEPNQVGIGEVKTDIVITEGIGPLSRADALGNHDVGFYFADSDLIWLVHRIPLNLPTAFPSLRERSPMLQSRRCSARHSGP